MRLVFDRTPLLLCLLCLYYAYYACTMPTMPVLCLYYAYYACTMPTMPVLCLLCLYYACTMPVLCLLCLYYACTMPVLCLLCLYYAYYACTMHIYNYRLLPYQVLTSHSQVSSITGVARDSSRSHINQMFFNSQRSKDVCRCNVDFTKRYLNKFVTKLT